jgi:hypothetical protein
MHNRQQLTKFSVLTIASALSVIRHAQEIPVPINQVDTSWAKGSSTEQLSGASDTGHDYGSR